MTYTTISEANTFIRVHNAVITPQNGKIAILAHQSPGVYIVEIV